ncbi:MAG: transporter substrate-binding domain-containing protein, partial [Desulfobacterales bacterium]|nr:transporter substrate-binding domain-containing protein [Desulfobacterales bacterium]
MKGLMNLLFGLVIFLNLLIVSNAEEKNIRLTIGEWPPLYSEKLKHYGVMSHITEEAFALEGVKVQWGFFPWARAFDLAKKGDWHGTSGWSPTDERSEFFYFSDRVYEEPVVFFYLKESKFDWTSIESL